MKTLQPIKHEVTADLPPHFATFPRRRTGPARCSLWHNCAERRAWRSRKVQNDQLKARCSEERAAGNDRLKMRGVPGEATKFRTRRSESATGSERPAQNALQRRTCRRKRPSQKAPFGTRCRLRTTGSIHAAQKSAPPTQNDLLNNALLSILHSRRPHVSPCSLSRVVHTLPPPPQVVKYLLALLFFESANSNLINASTTLITQQLKIDDPSFILLYILIVTIPGAAVGPYLKNRVGIKNSLLAVIACLVIGSLTVIFYVHTPGRAGGVWVTGLFYGLGIGMTYPLQVRLRRARREERAA